MQVKNPAVGVSLIQNSFPLGSGSGERMSVCLGAGMAVAGMARPARVLYILI